MKFNLHKVKAYNKKLYVIKVTSICGKTIRNQRELEPGNSRWKQGYGQEQRKNIGTIKGDGISLS